MSNAGGTGYNGPGGVWHEFVPPPPDDRDAIKVILAGGAFFALVICALIASIVRDLGGS